jgi:RNA polymerase sigma-70 factor (ECF subfamily)
MASHDSVAGEVAGTTTAPDATLERIDLDRAIVALPIGARLAFILHDVMGYPLAEIAHMTDVAVGTVKAQLHRARSLLRKTLADSNSIKGQLKNRERGK